MWRNKMLGGFDVETTGVDVETARIVTACVLTVNDAAQWLDAWLVNPGVEIPEQATAVHGVTTEQAQTEGVHPATAIGQIRAALARIWDAGAPVVGQNIVYDFTVLDRESRRHGLGPFSVAGPVIDTMVIDKKLDRYRKGKRTLETLCRVYQVRIDAAHNAIDDVLASCRVAWKQAARVLPDKRVLADIPLAQLHSLQVQWYREQADSFAAYRAKRGEPLVDINLDWPLKPFAPSEQHPLTVDAA